MMRGRRAEAPSFMRRPLDRGAEALPGRRAASPSLCHPYAAATLGERFLRREQPAAMHLIPRHPLRSNAPETSAPRLPEAALS